jgi:hypothetical protein
VAHDEEPEVAAPHVYASSYRPFFIWHHRHFSYYSI